MPSRRGRSGIVMAILESACDGVKRTHIMLKARLSFSQFEKYLGALKKEGFVTEDSGVLKTTEKGKDVISLCQLCHRLTEEIP